MTGRFKKIEGLDYKQGARDYPQKLAPSDRHHLYTKPFYNLAHKISRWSGEGLDDDTHRHFCDFANMAYSLALPAGARILDVGCGSGWLCEYFARLGYDVTGLDISPDLIQIARERVGKFPFGVDHESELRCRFLIHDIEARPLPDTFAAIICYDSLHHFEDEHAVLRNIAAMLDYGGLLFVAEGEKPPMGSQSEAELKDVMARYETLEAPFDREYLLELLQQHGFAVVGDYVAITGLVDRENLSGNTLSFVETPSLNYLLCKKLSSEEQPGLVPDSTRPQRLLAEFSLESEWTEVVSPASMIEVKLRVRNIGDTVWLVSRAPLKGRVRLGLKILNLNDETVAEIHGHPPLQTAIAPTEEVYLVINCKAPESPGSYRLKVDLVDQDVCWFEQHGSKPLELGFKVDSRL